MFDRNVDFVSELILFNISGLPEDMTLFGFNIVKL